MLSAVFSDAAVAASPLSSPQSSTMLSTVQARVGKSLAADQRCKLRFIVLSFEVFYLPDDAFASKHFTKHHVLSIEMGCGNGGDKELRSV